LVSLACAVSRPSVLDYAMLMCSGEL
jgi:hypothetical protein